jgi:DNA-binding transcriptional MerR regulator
MIRYTINDLANISQIKPHTIRIWEQRYNLLEPRRTSTNIRYYDDAQLKKLLNITTLLQGGHKISKIANLTDVEMGDKVKKLLETKEQNNANAIYINELLISALTFDPEKFEKVFSTCLLRYGFSTAIETILYPMLYRVGVMWQSEEINPAQEHFISNLARQKLFSAIDGIPIPPSTKNKCLLFLPQHEEHELGLLYSHYLLLKSGIRSYYLGQRLPFENLMGAVEVIDPNYLIFFFITPQPFQQLQNYINKVNKPFPERKIYLCGPSKILNSLKPGSPNCTFIHSIEEFKANFII